MQFKIDHLARHEECLPVVAEWQLAEFGYLNRADTLEGRTARLNRALQTDGLPLSLVAVSEEGQPVGATSISVDRDAPNVQRRCLSCSTITCFV